MSVRTTRALLLAHAAERSADRAVTALTEDRGLLTVTARAARGSAAKLGGVLEPFALTTLTYAEGRARPTAVGSVPEEVYRGLGVTPLGYAAAHVLADALRHLQREHTGGAALFELSLNAIRALDAAAVIGDAARIWWVVTRFLAALLTASGVGVALDRCARCGGAVEPPALWATGRGGLVHPEHAGGAAVRLDAAALTAVNAAANPSLKPPTASLIPLTLLLREVQVHAERELPSVRYAVGSYALPLPSRLTRLLYSEH